MGLLWLYRIGFVLDCLVIVDCLGDIMLEAYIRLNTPASGTVTLLLLALFVAIMAAVAYHLYTKQALHKLAILILWIPATPAFFVPVIFPLYGDCNAHYRIVMDINDSKSKS